MHFEHSNFPCIFRKQIESPLEAIIAATFDFPMFKIYNVRGTELVVSDDEAASTDEDEDRLPTAKRARAEATPADPLRKQSSETTSASSSPVKPKPQTAPASKAATAVPVGEQAAKPARRRKRQCKAEEIAQAAAEGRTVCACLCKSCVDLRLSHFKKAYPKSMKGSAKERRIAELGSGFETDTKGVEDMCACSMCARRRVNEYERATGRCAAADAKAACRTCKCKNCFESRMALRIQAYEGMCPCDSCNAEMERYSKGWPVTRYDDWDDCCACTECTLRRIDEHEAAQATVSAVRKDEEAKAAKALEEAKNPSFKGLSGLAGALSKGGSGASKAAQRKAAAQKAATLRRLAARVTGDVSREQLRAIMKSPTTVLKRDVSAVTPLEYQQRWSAFDTVEQLGVKAAPQFYAEEPDAWEVALAEVLPRVESAKKKGNSLFSAGKLPLAFRSYWAVAQLLHALQHMFFGDCLTPAGTDAVEIVLGTTAAAALCNCLYVATTLKMWDEAEFAARMCASGWCRIFPKFYLRLSAMLEEMGHSSAAYDAVKMVPVVTNTLVEEGEDGDSFEGVLSAARKREVSLGSARSADVQRYGSKTAFHSGGFPERDPLTNALLCGSFELVGVTNSVSVRQYMQRLRASLLVGSDTEIEGIASCVPSFPGATIAYTCPSTGALRMGFVGCTVSYELLGKQLQGGFLDVVKYNGRQVWGYPYGLVDRLGDPAEQRHIDTLASAALYFFSFGTCGNSYMDEQFAVHAAHYKRCIQQHVQAGNEWGSFGGSQWACSLDTPLQPYYGFRFAKHLRSTTAFQLPPRAAEAPKAAGDELFAAYGFSCPHLEGTDAQFDGWKILDPCEAGAAFKLPAKYAAGAASGAGAAAGGGPGSRPSKCPLCAVSDKELAALRTGNSGHVIKYSMEDDTQVRQNLMKSAFMKKIMGIQVFPE